MIEIAWRGMRLVRPWRGRSIKPRTPRMRPGTTSCGLLRALRLARVMGSARSLTQGAIAIKLAHLAERAGWTAIGRKRLEKCGTTFSS
jgi:hypothetical protein